MKKQRLAAFIRDNIEAIAAEWVKFAGTLLPEEEFSVSVLKNSVEDLLEKVAVDMDETQTDAQQRDKSYGITPKKSLEDAADTHVDDRIKMGLSSQQLISEFRALRASVIRLWQNGKQEADLKDLYDLTRFNEVIDEALTEAESRYVKKITQSRELFLGILGHDLRNPLGAIAGSAALIQRAPTHPRNADLSGQILLSTGRMSHMITDLIELTRVKLGEGISVNPVKTNMREICIQVINEMKAMHPRRKFLLEADDGLSGEWDRPRLSQVLSNLIGNAIQHGAPDSEIIVSARKEGDGVTLRVHNEGDPIPPKLIPTLFDKFVQESTTKATGETKIFSMGLGLYIAKEIVLAHGGTISAESSEEEGTNFIASLPRAAQHSAAAGS